MKVKRILHIVGRMDRAGAETMVMNLYRAIDRNKFQFDFLYFTNDICDYDEEIVSLGGKIYRLPNENTLSRGINIFNFLKTERNFHAIHSHMLFSNGINMLVSYLANYKRRIVHSHNTSDANSNSFLGKSYQLLSRKLINTFGSKFVACGIEAEEFLFPNNFEVVQLPNAIDVDYFNQCGVDNKDYLRNILEIDNDKLIIAQIGRLSHVKNHEFTIKLATKLKEQNISFHMVFVGDGSLKEKLIELSKYEDINDNISFLGIREDIPEILAGSDVMLMPSHHEGFPVVLVESQSVGIPALISTNVSSEVDLGVGLVSFIPLSNMDLWVNEIKNLNIQSLISPKQIKSIISSKGFDITKSVKTLIDIYR